MYQGHVGPLADVRALRYPWMVIMIKGESGNRVSDCWKPEHPLPRVGEWMMYFYPHYKSDGHTVESEELINVKVTKIVHALHPTAPAIWVYARRENFFERYLRFHP